MTLDHVLAGLPVEAPPESARIEIRGVCCDSRRVRAGDLFVVWSGGHHDGRAFAGAAVERGASAVLAPQAPLEGWGARVPWIVADDPRWLLGPLAARVYGHPERELRMVAVTGTNGKTTTTYLLRSLLERAGYPCGVLGTLGYRFGTLAEAPARTTPEASDLYRLLREMRDAGAAAVALEASSHALAQGRLRGTRFEAAVFTNLTRDHLDFHGDMESYFAAKRRLFEEHLAAAGRAVINRDDEYGRRLLEQVGGALSYGERDAEVCVERVELDIDGIHGRLATPRGPLELETPLIGRYNLWNVLAAVAAGEALELDREAIAEALAEQRPIVGRLEPVDAGQSFPVLIDFAHTPAGLEAALSSLRAVWPGKVVVVFGCGGDKDRGKRPLMGRLAGELSDLAIVTDDNPRTEEPAAIHRQVVEGLEQSSRPETRWEVIGNRRAAIRRGLEAASAEPGWAVLIAGKGHEDTQVVGTVATPFSDRVEVERILKEGARGKSQS
ncbi:MAG TPA: UDP-N-acetylmuramoyl-L-alanyl-D-glutamate--2,6-diaminopimelate ligase [Thermoanaerobaculia bacterium]|nr:UDP-N-acetylmuramoyl-L-alanyl-D-glutamate--2,6-diaminopimelate ligase [Thermoanaerobaculia bacterium]